MADPVRVYKGRTNIIQANLGVNVSADTLVSEIRELANSTSPLICTWTITNLTDGVDGRVVLRLDDSALATVVAKKGFMDIKRISGGEPLPVFLAPVPVVFVDTVTL